MKKLLCVLMAGLILFTAGCGKKEEPEPVTETVTITLKQPEHGTASISETEVLKGSEVTLNLKPEEGYELGEVLFNGNDVLISDKNLSLTFAATENTEIEVLFNEIIRNIPPEGKVFSDITGLPIDERLDKQRPLAVMVDNESVAYPHFGIAESDLVYEMMNSTHNGRITRLMCLIKDWEQIEMMGSIRSTRPTNLILMGEWNAILCHDGGPKNYVKPYYAKDYAKERFNATFSRVNNGKATEFTEYILKGDIERSFKNSGYSKTYTALKPDGEHFQFVNYETERDLNEDGKGISAKRLELPFPHNGSKLIYNENTETYDYYCYGTLHKDGEDGQVLSFKNVIIYECSYKVYDSKGYMIYNIVGNSGKGYYLTNGYAQKITWTKGSKDTDMTHYYDENGAEIVLNRGKIYIGIVPSDVWGDVVLK